jgi:multiple sugar transport system permease protein
MLNFPALAGRRWLIARKRAGRIALYFTIALVCLVIVFPLYWLVINALIPGREVFRYPPAFFPQSIRLDAYREIIELHPILTWLKNSFVVSAGTVLLSVLLEIMGAYALSRHGWPGRRVLAVGLLSTQMIPSAVLVIPIFIIFRQVGLVDSHIGLITVDTALTVPVGIWILKGAFDTIPAEIADAALADGCSELGVIVRMLLPLSLPALVAVSVIAFFTAWDEFVFASVFIISQSLRVFSVGISTFIGEMATPVDLIFAAASIFVIAPLIFYAIVERYLVSGLSAGAVKG